MCAWAAGAARPAVRRGGATFSAEVGGMAGAARPAVRRGGAWVVPSSLFVLAALAALAALAVLKRVHDGAVDQKVGVKR